MKMNAFCEPDIRNSLRRNVGCTIWTRITPRGAVLPPTASVAVCSSAFAAFCICDSESLFCRRKPRIDCRSFSTVCGMPWTTAVASSDRP